MGGCGMRGPGMPFGRGGRLCLGLDRENGEGRQ
jgi:hypothetical protein